MVYRSSEQAREMPRYHLSGRLHPFGLPAALATSLVAVAAIAWVHGLVMFEIMLSTRELFSHFACLVCAPILGIGIGVVTGKLLRVFKNRNTPLTSPVVLIVSLNGLYQSWAAWVYLALLEGAGGLGSATKFFGLIFLPDRLGVSILRISEVRMSENWSSTVAIGWRGVTWLGWSVEAILIVGFGVFSGLAFARAGTFCEDCKRWCVRHKLLARSSARGEDTLKAELLRGEFGSLERIEDVDPTKPLRALEVSVQRCPRCGKAISAEVRWLNRTLTPSGAVSSDYTIVLPEVQVSEDAVRVLMRHPGENSG